MVCTRHLIFKSFCPWTSPLVTLPRTPTTIFITVTSWTIVFFQFSSKVQLFISLLTFFNFFLIDKPGRQSSLFGRFSFFVNLLLLLFQVFDWRYKRCICNQVLVNTNTRSKRLIGSASVTWPYLISRHNCLKLIVFARECKARREQVVMSRDLWPLRLFKYNVVTTSFANGIRQTALFGSELVWRQRCHDSTINCHLPPFVEGYFDGLCGINTGISSCDKRVKHRKIIKFPPQMKPLNKDKQVQR